MCGGAAVVFSVWLWSSAGGLAEAFAVVLAEVLLVVIWLKRCWLWRSAMVFRGGVCPR